MTTETKMTGDIALAVTIAAACLMMFHMFVLLAIIASFKTVRVVEIELELGVATNMLYIMWMTWMSIRRILRPACPALSFTMVITVEIICCVASAYAIQDSIRNGRAVSVLVNIADITIMLIVMVWSMRAAADEIEEVAIIL